MINKLKRKFILTATVCMFLLMTALVLIMNIVNYCGVISESNAVLDVLSLPDAPFLKDDFFNDRNSGDTNTDGRDGDRKNRNNTDPSGENRNGETRNRENINGEDRDENPTEPPSFPSGGPGEMRDFIPRGMSPEVPFESRFFVVTVSADGGILQADLSRIISVDEDSAKEYIDRAINSRKDRGFIGDFRYSKTADENGTKILFLDCGRRLDSFRSFLWISVASGLFGCLIVFLAFVLTAGRIVAPIAESYEKQKRFISDAGHEIRTPLTIINANVDLLESEGEKEELTDIREQVRRLTELTNNLVLLSKMEEPEHTIQKTEIPLSDLVSKTAGSFRAPAVSNGLDLTVQVAPDLTICGAPDTIRQLVSILLENAVKYSPEGGGIALDLSARKKAAVLTIVNPTKETIGENELQHVFDRFYRTDTSRNSLTGGHGIGLSIAKAIVSAHGGTISAATKSGRDFCVTVTLPL